MVGRGRKSLYDSLVAPRLDEIKEWFGFMSECDIANQLGIRPETFYRYKKDHPELVAALNEGRKALVADLKLTLKKKAKGFHYTETKRIVRNVGGVETAVIERYEKYSPPDTGAIHLLLKNLDEEWRNDDKPTMDLKKEKLKLDRQKHEDLLF